MSPLPKLSVPLEATLEPPIGIHGFGDCYEDYEAMFPTDVRKHIRDTVASLAVGAGIENVDERLLVCGFSGPFNPNDMAAVDAVKLAVRSSTPEGGIYIDDESDHFGFDGDDSNQANIIAREQHDIRSRKLAISQQLQEAYENGTLTDVMRQEAAAELKRLTAQIAVLQLERLSTEMPVYYTTPFSGITHEDPEHSPLAYLGDAHPDSPGVIAVFDSQSIHEAGIHMEEKDVTQIRVYTPGSTLMKHCVAIVHIPFTSNPESI